MMMIIIMIVINIVVPAIIRPVHRISRSRSFLRLCVAAAARFDIEIDRDMQIRLPENFFLLLLSAGVLLCTIFSVSSH